MATGRIGATPNLSLRWSKAPSAGTTSLSGNDDNSVSLVYTVGYEQVYRNGVLLSRGSDYTATNGTSITLIDATIAGDIVEVFSNAAVPLSNVYTQTTADGKFINNTLVDAKGDIVTATANDTPAKLTVGTNNQVLLADSTTATGLKWGASATSVLTTTGDTLYASSANTLARLGVGSSGQVLTVSGGVPSWATPSSGGMTLISTTTLSGASVTLSSIPQTYIHLQLIIRNHKPASDSYIYARFNGVSSSVYFSDTISGYYNYNSVSLGTETTFTYTSNTDNTIDRNSYIYTLFDYANTATYKIGQSNWYKVGGNGTDNFMGVHNTLYAETSAISSILLANSTGNFTSGTVYLYGVK